MRRDVLTGDWISVAAARQNRAFLPPAELDPLAPQTPTNPSEIPSRYDVAVFENRSPVVRPGPREPHRRRPRRDRPPRGLDDLDAPRPRPHPHLRRPLRGRVLQPRARGLVRHASPDPRPHGDRGLGRPHGRAVGAARHRAGVPVREPRRGDRRHAARTRTGRSTPTRTSRPRTHAPARRDRPRPGPTCSPRILDVRAGVRAGPAARRALDRVRAVRRALAARGAPACRTATCPTSPATTDAERDELAPLYLRLLRGVDALYDTPTPYIAAWHQAPVNVGRDAVRLHLQLTSPRRAADKLKFLAGSEAAMGAWIGDVPPETPRRQLREAIDSVPEVTL